jgi:hypothetical protein
MTFSRTRVVFVVVVALVAGTAAPVFAAESLDEPTVVAADLVWAPGKRCNQPPVGLSDDWLDVLAQTESDSSLQLDAGTAAGQRSVEVECVLQVHIQFDRPAAVKPSEYLMSGSVNTSPGTSAGHWLESSFDATTWYGQRNTAAAGSVGPFSQGGGSRFDPSSECTTDLNLSLRVGLALTSASGLTAGDSVSLDAPHGAELELSTVAGACA